MKKFFIFLLVILLSGCSKSEEPKEPAIFTTNLESSKSTSDTNYVVNNKILYGIYSKDFSNTDNVTKVSNIISNIDIYAIEADIEENFPSEFVLKCYSESKTPSITVKYSSSVPDMIKFAKSAGEFDIPLIIDLFIFDEAINYDAYNENLRIFCNLIKKYAPNAKIVLSINPRESIADLFPEKNLFDFIGIVCYIQDPYDNFEQINLLKNTLDNLKYEKPLIITKFAVSHFSSKDHIYKIEGAENFIEYFYNKFINSYPQVKAVIYANEKIDESKSLYFNDYRILSDKQLLNKIIKIIK